jgi:hypothetical protein
MHMRDDLHKTVPLSSPWRKVLRCLGKEKGSDADIARHIAAAAVAESGLEDKINGHCLLDILDRAHPDLFGDGESQMRDSLLQFLDCSPPAAARSICEIALGILSQNGLTPGYKNQVIQEACFEQSKDQIELITAKVRKRDGMIPALEVHQRLTQALSDCAFVELKVGSIRHPPKSTSGILDTELALNA